MTLDQAVSPSHMGGMTFDLRPYQSPVVYNTVLALAAEGTRAQVAMACGTGKSLVGVSVVERVVEAAGIDAPLVVLMFPNLSLLSQTIDTWARHSSLDFARLAICSDIEPDQTHDTAGETVADTVEATGTGWTTSPAHIVEWVLDPANKGRARVLFSTYQSSGVLRSAANRLRKHGQHIDFLLADEAHKTVGATPAGTPVAELSPFGLVVSKHSGREVVPARRRLFMTATPKNAYVSKVHDHRSMDNETLYGKVTGDYPFATAIHEGNLLDYEVHVVEVRAQDVHAATGRPLADIKKEYVAVGSRRAHRDVAAVALLHMIKTRDLRSVMVFHNRRDDSAKFSQTLNALGGEAVFARHVDSATPMADRRRVLDMMRSARDNHNGPAVVVSNCDVFTEGVDVPGMDAVMIADTRTSKTEVAQIVGRALRLPSGTPVGGGKDLAPALVLLPALGFDADDDEDTAVTHGTHFHDVYATLRALASFDGTITETLTKAESTTLRQPTRTRWLTAVPDTTPDTGDDLDPDAQATLVEHTTGQATHDDAWEITGDGEAVFAVGGEDSDVAIIVPADEVPTTVTRRATTRAPKKVNFHRGLARRTTDDGPLRPTTMSPQKAAQLLAAVQRFVAHVTTKAIYTGANDATARFAAHADTHTKIVTMYERGLAGRTTPWPSLFATGTDFATRERALAKFLVTELNGMYFDPDWAPLPDMDDTFTAGGVSWRDDHGAPRAIGEAIAKIGNLTSPPKVDPDVPESKIANTVWHLLQVGARKHLATA